MTPSASVPPPCAAVTFPPAHESADTSSVYDHTPAAVAFQRKLPDFTHVPTSLLGTITVTAALATLVNTIVAELEPIEPDQAEPSSGSTHSAAVSPHAAHAGAGAVNSPAASTTAAIKRFHIVGLLISGWLVMSRRSSRVGSAKGPALPL